MENTTDWRKKVSMGLAEKADGRSRMNGKNVGGARKLKHSKGSQVVLATVAYVCEVLKVLRT